MKLPSISSHTVCWYTLAPSFFLCLLEQILLKRKINLKKHKFKSFVFFSLQAFSSDLVVEHPSSFNGRTFNASRICVFYRDLQFETFNLKASRMTHKTLWGKRKGKLCSAQCALQLPESDGNFRPRAIVIWLSDDPGTVCWYKRVFSRESCTRRMLPLQEGSYHKIRTARPVQQVNHWQWKKIVVGLKWILEFFSLVCSLTSPPYRTSLSLACLPKSACIQAVYRWLL